MQKIDISTSSFVRFFLIILGLWLAYLIRDILALLFIVLIVVAGLDPIVKRWSRFLTRPGAIVVVFALIFAVITLAGYILIPPLANEIQQFGMHLPGYISSISNGSHGAFLKATSKLVSKNINSVTGPLGNISNAIVQRTIGVLDGLVAVITIIVLAFYLLVNERNWKNMYRGIIPHEIYDKLDDTVRKITDKLGSWVRGQLLLMFLVGLLTFIGLSIVRTPYALALASLTALFEIIPIIGPWISAVAATLVALAISPVHGLLTLVVLIIIQEFEGHYLAPKVVGQAVGLNPVFVIVALLIGATLYGVVGALLAVPVAAIISVVVEDWQLIRETFGGS